MDDLRLSRPSNARGERMVELRGECPKSTVDVLDAICCARDLSRTELVNEILGRWARQMTREAVSVVRVAGINTDSPEGVGA